MLRHQSRRLAGYRKHVPDVSLVRTTAGRAQADDRRAIPDLSLPGNLEGRIRVTGPAVCRQLPVVRPASSGDAPVSFIIPFREGGGSPVA
jgi:hypothetical protein